MWTEILVTLWHNILLWSTETLQRTMTDAPEIQGQACQVSHILHPCLFGIMLFALQPISSPLATSTINNFHRIKVNYPPFNFTVCKNSTFYLLVLWLMWILAHVFLMWGGKVQPWLFVYWELAHSGAGWCTATQEAWQIKEPWQWKADVTGGHLNYFTALYKQQETI